jgi:hypothetical protein
LLRRSSLSEMINTAFARMAMGEPLLVSEALRTTEME